MARTAEESIMKLYLRKLILEHRALNRMIAASRTLCLQGQLKELKRLRFQVKAKISALQRHYYGFSRTV